MRTKNLTISLLIVALLLPSFGLAQTAPAPQTMAEAQSLGLDILNRLPEAIQDVWQNQAVPIWLNMWDWTKNAWQSSLGARVNSWWDQILDWVGLEKPNIKEEFQKERQETGQDLWSRFMDLLK